MCVLNKYQLQKKFQCVITVVDKLLIQKYFANPILGRRYLWGTWCHINWCGQVLRSRLINACRCWILIVKSCLIWDCSIPIYLLCWTSCHKMGTWQQWLLHPWIPKIQTGACGGDVLLLKLVTLISSSYLRCIKIQTKKKILLIPFLTFFLSCCTAKFLIYGLFLSEGLLLTFLKGSSTDYEFPQFLFVE